MPSPTRKRKRSASPSAKRSPSRRMKQIDRILGSYFNHISKHPENYNAVRRGTQFMNESYPMLNALRQNGRNELQKYINIDPLAQATLSNMRNKSRKFKKNPRTAIGQTPANLSPVILSPRRPSNTKYMSMFPYDLKEEEDVPTINVVYLR
jgi:hypothetical protein